MDVIEVLKALSDETRIRIITLLSRETLCVCELEIILNLGQSNISRHVTRLKQVKLVAAEKKAQWIYYRVDKKIFDTYPFLTELFQEHFSQLPQCQADLLRLKEHEESGANCDVLMNDTASLSKKNRCASITEDTSALATHSCITINALSTAEKKK